MSQCGKEQRNLKPNPDFTGNIYKIEGLSVKLYPEYKKIKEDEAGILFSSDNGEIAIIVFREDVIPLRKFYSSKYGTSTISLENCHSYLFLDMEKDGFRRFQKARLEIFPQNKDIQITILAREIEKKSNKMMDMLSTIKIE